MAFAAVLGLAGPWGKPTAGPSIGSIGTDDTKQFLQKFVERFVEFVRRHADAAANR